MAKPVRAPELVGRGGWIGVGRPLTLASLRGKVVLVHFWTSSSAACGRVLRELGRLENRFPDELVVLGVHGPKFPREAEHDVVVSAVARHRIGHPVLDDPGRQTWRRYGVVTAPTLVVIDPRGRVVATVSGEGQGRDLERSVAEVIAKHGAKGTLDLVPLNVDRLPMPTGPLAFPAKVAVSPDGQRLAIADTGHDQVLVCSLDGLVLEAHSGFVQPHGVRFDGERLLVCDTGADRLLRTGGEVVVDGVASPWDVVQDEDGWLVAAEAARHRLVRVRPGEQRLRVAAGTTEEGLEDGPAAKALLAQPSGLARTADGIAFVDAQSCALRLLTRHGDVVTLARERAFRLQHPLGLAADRAGGALWVADTLNSAVRVWDAGTLTTVPAHGLAGPQGLDALPDGRLVVADTDNHRVVTVDPDTGAVAPLHIDDSWAASAEGTTLAAAPGQALAVPFSVYLADEELDRSVGQPVSVTVEARPASLVANGPRTASLAESQGVVQLRAGGPGAGVLLVEAVGRTRRGDHHALRIHRRRHRLRVG